MNTIRPHGGAPMKPIVRSLALLTVTCLLFNSASRAIAATTFGSPVAMPFAGLDPGMEWCDFDRDDDLDLVYTSGSDSSRVFVNPWPAATWTTASPRLPLVHFGRIAAEDYDGDGDLDLALGGNAASFIVSLYRNDAGAWTLAQPLSPVRFTPAIAWGDFDNDGDPDFVVSEATSFEGTLRIYRNDSGTFGTWTDLPPLSACRLAVGDLDNDGDLDLLVGGRPLGISTPPTLRVYRNDGAGTFTTLTLPVTTSYPSDVAIGDYDADGRADVAVSGSDPDATCQLRVYHNDGGMNFTQSAGPFLTRPASVISWADADGDGALDLALNENPPDVNSATQVGVYYFTGDGFTLVQHALSPAMFGDIAWADVDGDRKPDLVQTGKIWPSEHCDVRLNTGGAANAAPGAPTGFTATVSYASGSARVTFRWTRPTDDHTPRAALTYDLRIGTSAGGAQISGECWNATSGVRRVSRFGRLGSDSTWTVALKPGTYRCAVQAVDGALTGGAPSAELVVTVPEMIAASSTLTPLQAPNGHAAVKWADADGDGKLDLLTAGTNGVGQTWFYRNVADSLVPQTSGLLGLTNAGVDWGDYDRDGLLDVAITGTVANQRYLQVYRQQPNHTFLLAADLAGMAQGTVAWGDFDDDGDLDLAVCGTLNGSVSGAATSIYRNDAGVFTLHASLLGVTQSHLAWGDIDRDGDLDLLVAGTDSNTTPVAQLYRNNEGVFTPIASPVQALQLFPSFCFVNADNDGDLDLMLVGSQTPTSSGGVARLYLNNGTGTFTSLPVAVSGVSSGAIVAGDWDGDGDADLAMSGISTSGSRITRILRNNGNLTFTTLDVGLPGLSLPGLAFGDVDGDGRLDLALAGMGDAGAVTKVFMNAAAAPNAPPLAPTNLTASYSSGRASLHWSAPSDDHTPPNALTYDVRLGISSRGGQIVPLPADSLTGLRQVMRSGRFVGDSAFVTSLADGCYYFTVQAVDAGLAGSALPAWQTVVGPSLLDAGDSDAPPTRTQIRAVSPNPAHGATHVAFDLPRAGDVDLSVYDAQGRRVATLLRATMAGGRQAARWDGTNEAGTRAAAGLYFVRLTANGHTDTKRVVLER